MLMENIIPRFSETEIKGKAYLYILEPTERENTCIQFHLLLWLYHSIRISSRKTESVDD